MIAAIVQDTDSTGLAGLAIRLFGPMQVTVQGQPLPPLRSRKSLYLLALLALRPGRPVEREWLAGTLWPDVDQSQAFDNLRPALSALRTALGTEGRRLESPNRHTLYLDLLNAEVDVLVFDAAVTSGNRTALEQAVGLYRGPLLEGCTEEWIVQDREARHQECFRALQKLTTAARNTGDFGTATNYLRRAVTLDPLAEGVRRELMVVLVEGGDSNAALQVYREFVTALQGHDPRAVPDEETTALYRRLRKQIRQRAHSSALPIEGTHEGTTPVSGYLPPALTALIGREDEVLEVSARLRRSRLVTLTGPGGIGKTRLALAIATEVVKEFPDGAWFIALESLAPGKGSRDEDGRPIIQQIATVLGVKERIGRSLLNVLTEYLHNKRLLLVLDNCEHLIEPCAAVSTYLLLKCPGVRILATSREALRVSGETAWSVPALEAPDVEHLPTGGAALVRVMAGYDSVQLFVDRARAVNKTFTLTGDNAKDVAQLCSRLEGVPLALELAAARMRLLSPAQILGRFDAHLLDTLKSRQPGVALRHRTLRAALEWSYSLCPAEVQEFLTCLSVFRGGWTLEAAESVCPDADALEMLTLLCDASLITFTADEEGGRYSMLETVRQFAAERLEQSDRAGEVRRRRTDFFIGLLVRSYNTTLVTIEREHPNLIATLEWARDEGKDFRFEYLCATLIGFLERSGRSEERRYWLDIAAHRIAQEDDNTSDEEERAPSSPFSFRRGVMLYAKQEILAAVGDREASAEVGIRNFEAHRSIGNPLGGRTYLYNAASSLVSVDLKWSLEILEQCLPLEREASEDGRANPVILAQLAYVTRLVGQTGQAEFFLAEAMALSEERGDSDPMGRHYALREASLTALAKGAFSVAQERCEIYLSFSQRIKHVEAEAMALCTLAILARLEGDQSREEALLSEATTVAGKHPGQNILPRLRRDYAESHLSRGDSASAVALVREAMTTFRGKARSFRLSLYPLLLLLADAEGIDAVDSRRSERVARLLGAANSVAERLGLLAPDYLDRERATRLRAALTERLGPEHLATEEAAGAALDEEAVLEYALLQE